MWQYFSLLHGIPLENYLTIYELCCSWGFRHFYILFHKQRCCEHFIHVSWGPRASLEEKVGSCSCDPYSNESMGVNYSKQRRAP